MTLHTHRHPPTHPHTHSHTQLNIIIMTRNVCKSISTFETKIYFRIHLHRPCPVWYVPAGQMMHVVAPVDWVTFPVQLKVHQRNSITKHSLRWTWNSEIQARLNYGHRHDLHLFAQAQPLTKEYVVRSCRTFLTKGLAWHSSNRVKVSTSFIMITLVRQLFTLELIGVSEIAAFDCWSHPGYLNKTQERTASKWSQMH